MATDGEYSDCQWLDLREHLQETMMFSSRFMFVFPVKFSMKKYGMQWCFTFSGKRNILFFSFAGLLVGLTWSIQYRGWCWNNFPLAETSAGADGVADPKTSLTSLDLHEHCLHISTQPRVKKAKTFCNIKASLKRGKNIKKTIMKQRQKPSNQSKSCSAWGHLRLMNLWNFPHRPKYHHSYCQRDTNCILDQSSSPFTKLSVAQHGFFWLTNAAGVDGRVPHAKNACYRTQVHDVKYVSNFCFDSWHCSMPASSMIIETRPFLAAKHDWNAMCRWLFTRCCSP